MPRQYEAIRDKCIRAGGKRKRCQSKAAAIYNSKHPNTPVTGKHKRKK